MTAPPPSDPAGPPSPDPAPAGAGGRARGASAAAEPAAGGGRAAVLARIRRALADVPPGGDAGPGAEDGSGAEDGEPRRPAIPRAYRRSHAGPDVPGLFAERAADYRATVIRGADPRADLAAALTRRGVTRLVVPEGFPPGLLPSGPWTVLGDRPPLSVPELDRADAVLTTCALAVAVTGTLVLDGGPGQGRRALTLLPDYHLCVVREGQIAPDLPDALARLDPVAPLTFVSGPSATSDIELDRVEGVHGPRTLDILIVPDDGPDARRPRPGAGG